MRKSDLFPSKYLKADDLKGKPITLKIKEVTQEIIQNGGESKKKPVVHFVGTAKQLILNATNYDSIALLHGDETDEWVGRSIQVYPDVTDMQGKTVPCVRINRAKPPAHAAAAEEPPPPTEEPPFGDDNEIPEGFR
jgi:hypothetical protein